MIRLTPTLLLGAYAWGLFPMAESVESTELFWFDPDPRAILPLDHFHVPRRLRRTVRQALFEVRCNTAFKAVILACRTSRSSSWINDEILEAYSRLNVLGHAHSVEAWYENRLVGGLYGVALGGAFFGESMFSHAADASKVALVHLVARLRRGGFTLLDTQFVTGHLSQFGVEEIPRPEYRRRLELAVREPADFAEATPDADDFAALFAANGPAA